MTNVWHCTHYSMRPSKTYHWYFFATWILNPSYSAIRGHFMTVCQIFLNVIHKTNQNVHFCRRIHLICALLQYWATWCRHSRGGSSNWVLGKARALLYRQGKSTHLGQSLPPTLPRPKTLKYSRTETLLYSYTKTLYRIPTPRHCCSIHALCSPIHWLCPPFTHGFVLTKN